MYKHLHCIYSRYSIKFRCYVDIIETTSYCDILDSLDVSCRPDGVSLVVFLLLLPRHGFVRLPDAITRTEFYFPKGFSNLRCLIISAAILGQECCHCRARGVKARRVCDLDVSQQSSSRERRLNSNLMEPAAWLHFLHSLNVLLGDIYICIYVSLHLLLGFLSEQEKMCVCVCTPSPTSHPAHPPPRLPPPATLFFLANCGLLESPPSQAQRGSRSCCAGAVKHIVQSNS